jgi:hypothetical protein
VSGKRTGGLNSQDGEGEEGETGDCDGQGSRDGVLATSAGVVHGLRHEVGSETEDDDRAPNAYAWTDVSCRRERKNKKHSPQKTRRMVLRMDMVRKGMGNGRSGD